MVRMMVLRKWDFTIREYLPFKVPATRRVVLVSWDMDLEIDCTNCGKAMTYGQGYTSRTIHNPFGLGYPVCGECYTDEQKLEWSSK